MHTPSKSEILYVLLFPFFAIFVIYRLLRLTIRFIFGKEFV